MRILEGRQHMDSTAISVVGWVINLVRAYAIAGLIFALLFVTFLVKRVDSGAQGWAIGFRILIIPGVVAFWPMFAVRLLRGKGHPTEKNAHRLAAKQSAGAQ